MEKEQIELDWNKAIDYCVALANKVKEATDKGEINLANIKIVVILKGGVFPAYFIMDRLGVRKMYNLSYSSYKGKERKDLLVHQTLKPDNSPDILIIDDITHTGATRQKSMELFPNAKVAVLIAKIDGADYEMERVHPDTWVKFPWEDKFKQQ